MKTRWLSSIVFLFLLGALLLTTGVVQAQNPQPYSIEGGGGPGPVESAFTYQGMLKMGGAPVNGTCDFVFTLWDQSGSGAPPSGGNQIGAADVQLGVSVAKGLFTVVLNGTRKFETDPVNNYAFNGQGRWLQIGVACPAGSVAITTLSPRQPLWAVPYAISLMPGARIEGAEYQNLKVVNTTTVTGIPAGVTGEMKNSTDGVGVYGSNEVNTSGATGMGVWGRTWSPYGIGVKGTGLNGAIGVFAEGNGIYYNHPALYAYNSNTTAGEPGGVAIYARNDSGDATIIAHNTKGGDNYRALNTAGNYVVFRVDTNGHVYTSGVNAPGADVAEQFAVSSTAASEPGTLMVIDPEHPGQLKASSSAYDTKVAGVVSGAGGLQPGVTLSEQNGVAIALAGRVYVKAEARSGAIVPGDLLTSSDLPGYAMKASDRSRAAGAVIGKAMTGLSAGTGLVLVLVSLQ